MGCQGSLMRIALDKNLIIKVICVWVFACHYFSTKANKIWPHPPKKGACVFYLKEMYCLLTHNWIQVFLQLNRVWLGKRSFLMSNYFVLFGRSMQGSPGFAANQRGLYSTLNNVQNYLILCQKKILSNITCVLSIYFV